jgi:hypothetical protein
MSPPQMLVTEAAHSLGPVENAGRETDKQNTVSKCMREDKAASYRRDSLHTILPT